MKISHNNEWRLVEYRPYSGEDAVLAHEAFYRIDKQTPKDRADYYNKVKDIDDKIAKGVLKLGYVRDDDSYVHLHDVMP